MQISQIYYFGNSWHYIHNKSMFFLLSPNPSKVATHVQSLKKRNEGNKQLYILTAGKQRGDGNKKKIHKKNWNLKGDFFWLIYHSLRK